MKAPSTSAVANKYFEHLRYRGVRLKKHVLSPDCAIPSFRDLVWQSFKEHRATEGNILPLLIYNFEPQGPDPGMFPRRGPRNRKGVASSRICLRSSGQRPLRSSGSCARSGPGICLLATCYLGGSCSPTGPSPAGLDWGRRMRRIKGGVHCQKRYRELGWHPLDNVSRAMPKRHNGSANTPEGGHRSDGSPDHARKRLGDQVRSGNEVRD